MKNLFIVLTCFVMFGCATASKVSYKVISEPQKAPIDVNGVSMGKTPTTITLECSKRWVGVMNSPDGWANASGKYEVKAYPPKDFPGQSQTKNVDPCQWKGTGTPEIQFDLGLEKVTPVQKIEITNEEADNKSSLKKSLDALKVLKKQGVITEEEYKAKVLELVK